MRFDLITVFPDFFRGPLDYGVVARARTRGLIEVETHDLREYTHDRHQTTDDRPYGGGEGMVMKIEPIYACLERLLGAAEREKRDLAGTRVVLLSAQGRVFHQALAREWAGLERLVLIAGRYECVDERVAEYLADEELSIGDFVLSGGELAAALVLDAVARLLPGVLGDPQSAINESFAAAEGGEAGSVHDRAGLDYPHYTRPPQFEGMGVPEVLMEGNHAAIREWRLNKAREKTRRLRPDLLK